jgi:hypothetical protein
MTSPGLIKRQGPLDGPYSLPKTGSEPHTQTKPKLGMGLGAFFGGLWKAPIWLSKGCS